MYIIRTFTIGDFGRYLWNYRWWKIKIIIILYYWIIWIW